MSIKLFTSILRYPSTTDIDFKAVFGQASDSNTLKIISELSQARSALVLALKSKEENAFEQALASYAQLWFNVCEIMRSMRERRLRVQVHWVEYLWQGFASSSMFSYTSMLYESYMLLLCHIVHLLRSAVTLLEQSGEDAARAALEKCIRASQAISYATRVLLPQWSTRSDFAPQGTAPEIDERFGEFLRALALVIKNECLATQTTLKFEERKAQSLCSKLLIQSHEALARALGDISTPKLYESKVLGTLELLRDWYFVRAMRDKALSLEVHDKQSVSAALAMLYKARETCSGKHKKALATLLKVLSSDIQHLERLNDQVYFARREDIAALTPLQAQFPSAPPAIAADSICEQNPLVTLPLAYDPQQVIISTN